MLTGDEPIRSRVSVLLKSDRFLMHRYAEDHQENRGYLGQGGDLSENDHPDHHRRGREA
jgi:hypothetical protein